MSPEQGDGLPCGAACVKCTVPARFTGAACRLVWYCRRRCQKKHRRQQHRDVCSRAITIRMVDGEEFSLECRTCGRVRDVRRLAEETLRLGWENGTRVYLSENGMLLEDSQKLTRIGQGSEILHAVVYEDSTPSLTRSSSMASWTLKAPIYI